MEKENCKNLIMSQPSCSKPVHVQRLEKALDLTSFLTSKDQSYDTSDEEVIVVGSESESDSDSNNEDWHGVMHFLNVGNLSEDREWLLKILDEESEDDDDLYGQVAFAAKARKLHLSLTHKKKALKKNAYYSTGLFSINDKYVETKKPAAKSTKRKAPKENIKSEYIPTSDNFLEHVVGSNIECNGDQTSKIHNFDDDSNINSDACNYLSSGQNCGIYNSKKISRKFKDEESKKKWEDLMTSKRKKILTSMVKKEIGKQQRSKCNRHKELILQCKRVALQCQKVVRQKALQSARVVKEQPWRMKRLSRENLAYWKRSKRVDREIRRKLEKEAEEQRKMDFELVEAKRQQRKLNFLITQTELYAHFMSKKLGKASPEEQLRILSQLDEEKNPRLINIDDYDSEIMKIKAKKNAEDAFFSERQRTKNFDIDAHSAIENIKLDSAEGEHPQPLIFHGILKGYQLRGMNWLANLYDQGISGILADEMGLGKTVQSIAFLCHIAEKYSVWGPFLIISPASTLHNWQQEIAKFVPEFKVVPYWGNPNERKILRQFWDQKDMHTKEASFHIVVTSYQIVITDIKYFNRIKWQYMILDEAQAIKSTNSMRWKTLLGFSCRNRLLLSGTPIQNSMAELWALLHFIMPTLFDSHEEFNEWFSKDIESHAENKTGIDEKHLSRLHMILKPFMLRRIKKDVENELSDKIEVMVYCPLTTRQKLLYMALKQKIQIEDLLHYTVGGGDSHTVDKNFTSNLMNLVMQFRKVCNHPELFERRDAKSPLYIPSCVYQVPYQVYDFNPRLEKFLVLLKNFVFTPSYIHESLTKTNTIFNFCRSLKLSSQELYSIFQGIITKRWESHYKMEKYNYNLYYRYFWSKNAEKSLNFMPFFKMSPAHLDSCSNLDKLVFTRKSTKNRVVYTHTTHYYCSTPETVEHRKIRCKESPEDNDPIIDVINDELRSNCSLSNKEFPYRERTRQIFHCERTEMPLFLFCYFPKLEVSYSNFYCYSRRTAWDWQKHVDDYSISSFKYFCSKVFEDDVENCNSKYFTIYWENPIDKFKAANGWSNIVIPDKETLVTDSGKLSVLDSLLKRLKEGGHRVLIYSQMTKMIDLLEEYMWHRHHKYMRLDGSSKISERRDMVADFQAKADIFVFLLSTRAGGLGINLTAADTVIFYDSDWNPTVDQQAMDRAHRLGQTKQVTVYRLICKGSIEERILQRAREKSEIQKLVISGGNFKPDTLKPKEVVSLLLDDDELEQKYRQKTEEKKQLENFRDMERKRSHLAAFKMSTLDTKRGGKSSPNHLQQQQDISITVEGASGTGNVISSLEDHIHLQQAPMVNIDSGPNSPRSDNSPVPTPSDDLSDGSFLDVEGDTTINNKFTNYNAFGSTVSGKPRFPGRGSSKRGRPRGSRRMSALGRFNSNPSAASSSQNDSGIASFFDSGSSISSLDANITNYQNTSTLSAQNNLNAETSPATAIRRGPGRPRLKPGGPPNTGSRGIYRPRKPARPLPVPLPSDGGSTVSTNNATPSYTSYLYEYTDQHSSDS